MNKERDLLPWILGGLTAATVAVAFTAISTKTATPKQPTPLVASQAPSPVSAPLTLPPAAPPAAAPVAGPDPQTQAPAPAQAPVTAQAPVAAQAAVEPQAPGGQIWQCTTKGVKTFSNNPCGDKSTLLDVGPINTMNAMPASYARGYPPGPRYATAYTDQAPADLQENSEQYGSESAADSYPIVQGLAFVPRRRLEHPHRPSAHHNPVPVRRQ